MAIGNRIAGLTSLTVDGYRFDISEDFSWNAGGINRETMEFLSGAIGYREKPVAGMIKAKIADSLGLSVNDFNSQGSVQVTLTLGNGKTITMSNAYCTAEAEVGADGLMEVTYYGQTLVESR